MRRIILWLLIIFAAVPLRVQASERWSTAAEGNIRTGDVNIAIEEIDISSDGTFSEAEMDRLVIPGERVERIIRVTNLAEPAYVRVRPDFIYVCTPSCPKDPELVISGDDWVNKGEYYYFTKPLPEGGVCDFAKAVIIPQEWTSADAQNGLDIHITAEAVQEANFTPDFASDSPWYGTLIEKCVHEGYEGKKEKESWLLIEFKGGSEGFVKSSEDFLKSFYNLMPGGSVNGELCIKSSYRKSVDLYFETKPGEDLTLLKELSLTVKCGESVIYSGKMDGLLNKTKILTLKPGGEEQKLLFTIDVPAGLTNKYALKNGSVIWNFEAVREDENVKEEPETTAPRREPEEDTESPDDPSLYGLHGSGSMRRTGEAPYRLMPLCLAAVSFIMILAALTEWRKEDDNEGK